MAHLNRAQPDWKRGYVTVGNDLKVIDQNSFVAVNGDAGGTWTPGADLSIAGAGMVAAAPWTVAGASAVLYAPTFGKGTADDAFGLAPAHPGRSWTLVQALAACHAVYPEQVFIVLGPGGLIQGLQTDTPGARWLSPLRVYGGATLETVSLRFIVAFTHTVLPASLAQMRVIAVDALGGIFPMGAGALFDNGGFHAVSAASTAAAWNASSSPQTFTYVCSQNNVIDLAKFTYWLEIIEEVGPPATPTLNCFPAPTTTIPAFGNVFVSATSFLDGISLFDGRN